MGKPKNTTSVARFWTKVEKAKGCWNWKAGFGGNGYGVFWTDGENVGAHRYAFKVTKGPIPSGMFVCHSCDNRACVNPAHLWLGTCADNLADMAKKGRHRSRTKPDSIPRGEQHCRAKLSTAKAKKIRDMYATGKFSQRQLARRFGVAQTTLRAVVNGESWKEEG